MNYLSDTEKELVKAFVDNESMFEAVKKSVLHTITHQGVFKPGEPLERTNWIFSLVNNPLVENDAQLGQRVRSAVDGIGYCNAGFEKLKEITVDSQKKDKESNNAI